MSFQTFNHVINQPTKRRMCDDEQDDDNVSMMKDQGPKRLNDLTQEFNPNNEPPKPNFTLPSLTYASPDYRPPPRTDALWLQPVPQPTSQHTTTVNNSLSSGQPMDDDSTDEDDTLPTPGYQPHSISKPTQQSSTTNIKSNTGFDWIMTDQS
ncbi:uncharacterized protein BX664DRAFT_338342 [Halteromyces radiatus]|uniref:uncharacterized protein n=1 Tax=Halteromyces radiatus TaxID=101107 RepID=UPI0022205CAF|nr:uncharacterized protein BX664DRAFT_338342 [Halteromyces radiatus]KAI8085016.1 hypothetical protein BX664DRAFT_338342 [Halteromyces radiatus]